VIDRPQAVLGGFSIFDEPALKDHHKRRRCAAGRIMLRDTLLLPCLCFDVTQLNLCAMRKSNPPRLVAT